ncbi:MAG: antitoxin Xre/MbcA/ParS toxin-binding domain-containing protein [Cyanobacteria bacterium J06621_8]
MTQAIPRSIQDYSSVMKLADSLRLSREQVRKILGISESTQFRYEKKQPVLKPNLSDRWSRLTHVVELANDLFEDESEVQRWLSTPKQALGNRSPIDLLVTNTGFRQVEQLLLQASYGVFA